MLFSLRENEGYVLIDHRESPGLTPEELAQAGSNPLMPVGRGRKFEAPTFTCHHCDRIVILNPLRNRDRGYCQKCHHQLCDNCETKKAVDGKCNSRERRIDEFLERAVKAAI